MSLMTPVDIAALRGLVEKATKGPIRFEVKPPSIDAADGAGRVIPLEREYLCINGLNCWFTLGSIYTPDVAAVGYTDGALNEEGQLALGALIARVLKDLPTLLGEVETLREALAEIAAEDKWDENNPNAALSMQAMARAALSKNGGK